MIYRYIYKITCTKGSFKDKFYYGQHTTENLDDNYKGSGRKLWNYYKKHSNDYIKEIIAYYDTEDELNKAEYDIIHPYLGNKMCLNIAEGGHGGFTGYHSEESRQKMRSNRKKIIPWNKNKKMSKEFCEKLTNNWHKRPPVSEETRKKLKESAKHRPPVSEETRNKHSVSSK